MSKIKSHINGNDAGLTSREIEQLSEEIRQVITSNKPVLLEEYVQSAKKISIRNLGYRKSRALTHETRLMSYFPNEVIEALRSRSFKGYLYNESDNKYLIENARKGSRWLAKHFYTSVISVRCHARRLGVGFEHKYIFDEADQEYIKQNIHRGTKWISEELYRRHGTKSMSCDVWRYGVRLGVITPSRKTAYYTKKEDEFIRAHWNKPTKWLSEQMGRNLKSIRSRRFKLGFWIQILKLYKPEEDAFLRRHKNDKNRWVAQQLCRSLPSVKSRKSKLGIATSVVVPYTKEEDEFIKSNASKSIRWLAEKLGRTINSVAHRRLRLGIFLARKKYSHEEDEFLKQNCRKSTRWIAEKLERSAKSIEYRKHYLKHVKPVQQIAS